MKKSETEDSADEVFYSVSSAVSVTASDQTTTRTPSPVSPNQGGSGSSEKKSKGLSKLKSFRPRKLIPKRFKTSPEVLSYAPASPEMVDALLNVSSSESKSETKKSETKSSGKKESKIPKKTSRTTQIVRKLTFSKKGQKVGPKEMEADEDTSTTSSSTTPMSTKRELVENLNLSEGSLLPVAERSIEESSATDQSERKSSSASSSGKQELKITISGKKIENLKRFYESDRRTQNPFEEFRYNVSAVEESSMASDKTSSNAVNEKLKEKQKKVTNEEIQLPSPPPSPLMSYRIPLKGDMSKPISTISTTMTKRDQVPSTITNEPTVSNENYTQSVADRDEQSSGQEQQKFYLGDKNNSKIPTNKNKKESLKSKLINKLNISRSVHDITPTVLAPVVPYEISDQEVTTILKTSPSKESEESLEESITTSLQLSPEEYKEFIKKDREESLSELTSEKIFTVTDLNEASMKRSEEQLANINQNNNKSNNKKRSKKSPVQESSDSGLSTSVHVQEAQTPYQKQLSISKSNDLNEPETLEGSGEVTINKTGEISFRIGTPVRPPQTPTGISNITHITESVSIDSSKNPASLEEISSISSESQSPPLSENSRRKIKYIPQPTLETEEKEVFGPPSSVLSESYSIDYSLNPLSMAESQPEGQQGTQSGVTNLTMSSEKKEHLYKILVIGELGTGKTSVIKRYVHQFFSQNYRATIGVDFALKVLNWDPNTIIRLQLWDIAGQERFGNMTRVYYKEAVGAFIVFDVTRTSTFDAVIKWKQDLDSKVQLPDGSSIPCILLANKCDQPKQGIVTTPAKLDEYCKENGFSGWFETSAKENINIDDAAKALVNKILANDKVMNSHETEGDGFAIDGHDNGTSKKNCAC